MDRAVMGNGLRVLAKGAPTRSVALAFTARAGSNHELPEENGACHFLEHLLLKGTEGRPSSYEVALPIERLGGEMDGETDKEATTLYALIPADGLTMALEVLADVVQNPLLKEEDVKAEREIILKEYYQTDVDDPERRVQNLFESSVYEGSPASHPVLGDEETIAGMGRGTLLRYYEGLYTPPNAILSIVGGITPQEVLGMAERAFGSFGGEGVAPPVENRPRYGIRVREEMDVTQTHLVLGIPIPALEPEEALVMEAVAAYLGGGFTSRLVQRVREEGALAYDVRASLEYHPTYSYLAVYAVTGDEEAVEEIVREEIAGLWGMAGEVVGMQGVMKGRFLIESEDNLHMAGLLNFYELMGRADVVEGYERLVDGITSEGVSALVEEHLGEEKISVVALGPP